MVLGLFNRGAASTPRTGKGDRVYCVGDIHGRFDLFRAALDRIEAHHAQRPKPRQIYVVLLGDLIDRGPDSAKVLKLVHKVQARTQQMIVLRGNHEEMMIRVIDGEPGVMRPWLKSGGRDTLLSLGIEPPVDSQDSARVVAELRQRVPQDIIDWLRALPLTAQSGDYLFCHAGVRPGVPIKKQARDDLLWIREEFLGSTRDHGAVIVHGHSVSAELEMLPNRIGIDTGAYMSGVLSVLYLEDDLREVISIRESDLPVNDADDDATSDILSSGSPLAGGQADVA